MTPHNGHRSKAAWNVSLWIRNDEGLYRLALDCVSSRKTLGDAARRFTASVGTAYTPDGFRYSLLNVRLALADLDT